MTKTCKQLATLLVMVLLALYPGKASQAQTVAEVMQRTWDGGTVYYVDFTQTGKIILRQKLYLKVSTTNRVTGTVSSKLDFDGVYYYSQGDISGHLFTDTRTITIALTLKPGADALPYGLTWCDTDAELTLAADDDNYNHFLLIGTSQDDCGGGVIDMYFKEY